MLKSCNYIITILIFRVFRASFSSHFYNYANSTSTVLNSAVTFAMPTSCVENLYTNLIPKAKSQFVCSKQEIEIYDTRRIRSLFSFKRAA